jgi:hypothetical protein
MGEMYVKLERLVVAKINGKCLIKYKVKPLQYAKQKERGMWNFKHRKIKRVEHFDG